jgi:threonine aldolase
MTCHLFALSENMPSVDAALPFIDLRSDTVTRPTAAMYERMRHAELGDDGLDGDPTAHALEERVANLLGKESGLYVPTATMGNLLAVLTQVSRHAQVVMETTSHMFLTERSGSTLSGTVYHGITGTAGEMHIPDLVQALRHTKGLRTELVCMETTHVNAGGAVLSLEHMRTVYQMAHDVDARVHVDGARFFNAAVALNIDPKAIACFTDTISICLSKGISAPAGAVLVGPSATIKHARQLRKMLGGTQRQIGILAAAGLEGIDTMYAQLQHDHDMAQQLSRALRTVLPEPIRVTQPTTNITFVELPDHGPDSLAWAQALESKGVKIRPWGARRIRLVTHRHIKASSIDLAIEGFRHAAELLLRS